MDHAFDPSLRLPDGGPVYAETLPLGTLHERLIAEPLNAITAALFVVLAAWWWWRLSRDGRRDAFMAWALPVLALGGLGGAIYHATRAHRIWLLLDVVPIVALILGASVLLWRRILGRWWWAAFLVALLPILAVRQVILGSAGAIPGNVAALLGYGVFASLVLVPMLLQLRANAWRGRGLVVAVVASFAGGIACRTGDPYAAVWIPCGSHVFWHLLGLAACHFLIAWLAIGLAPQRVERSARL